MRGAVRFVAATAIVAGAFGSCVAVADTISVVALRDNTLYFSNDLLAQKSNAKGPFVYAGVTSESNPRRALVYFDLAAVIPSSATINSVTLTLTLDQTNSFAEVVSVHRVTAEWGEGTSNAGTPGGSGVTATAGDPTWLYRFFSTSTWSAPGGDFVAAPSATAAHSNAPGPKSWTDARLTQDARDFVADPSTNLGWIIIGNELDALTARRYHSTDSTNAAVRPVLVVDYTPCRADFDGTGFVDTDDFDAFIHAFEEGADNADFDESGFVDTDDFDAFVHAFETGC